MVKKANAKTIHNPVTGSVYSVSEKSSKAGQPGSVKGQWSRQEDNMKQIGTYSKKKTPDGEMTYLVTIPNARRTNGRYYPYISKFLTDDIDDIERTIRKDLDIPCKVKLVSSAGRGGKVMVT